jgi:DNA repair exonuclease SbcCD ATPase subunit
MRSPVIQWTLIALVAAHANTTEAKASSAKAAEAASGADKADLHAAGAEKAAAAAERAASVANQVATHAKGMHAHAQAALEHAHGALSSARKDTSGLSKAQKESLSKADDELTAATKKLESEELEQSEWVQDAISENEAEAASHAATEHLQKQVQELEKRLEAAQAANAIADKEAYEAELAKLKEQLAKQLEAEAQAKGTSESLGKMKDELEKMERQVDTMEDIKSLKEKIDGKEAEGNEAKAAEEDLRKQLQDLDGLLEKLEDEAAKGAEVKPETQKDLGDELRRVKESVAERIKREQEEMEAKEAAAKAAAAEAAKKKKARKASGGSPGVDLPYGQLEAFGREDTAAELTDESIKQSDRMVDQIEKAEVAEEKRSVFRALTRLRGAAITSYDGVARSQTGNIDEYNHANKWRDAHPVHHLADEENDVSHWAFPDNAD